VFLHLEGLSAQTKDVQTELVQVLESDVIAYSAVIKYRRNNVILENEPEAEERAENQGSSMTDKAILEAFEMILFASIRQIAKMAIILPATVFRRFTKSLHFFLKRLPWVPHRLSDLRK
jgi:hypothetical protein